MSENLTPTGDRPRIGTLRIDGPLAREDLPSLCARAREMLDRAAPEVLRCELADVGADGIAVEALARVALIARRRKCRLRLAGVSPQLSQLIEFAGLAEVLPG